MHTANGGVEEVSPRKGSARYLSEGYESEKENLHMRCNPESLRSVFIVAFLPKDSTKNQFPGTIQWMDLKSQFDLHDE